MNARGREIFMLDSNTHNFTLGRRELLSLIAALMALMALGIDILLPAFDDIRVAYGLSEDSSSPCASSAAVSIASSTCSSS